LPNGLGLDGTTGQITGAPLGTGTSYFTVAATDGYGHTVRMACELKVAPAALTVTANPQTKVYGSADPALTYSTDGLVPGDSAQTVLSGSLNRAAGESVAGGPYAIGQGSLAANANYSLAFTGSTLTITPAALTVTAQDQTRIAGEANPAFAVGYSGFVFGEGAGVLGGALTFSTPATAGSVPGTYAVTPGGLTSSNYALTFVPGTLTVFSDSQATTNLLAQVNAAGLARGVQHTLDGQLQTALKDFNRGHTTAAKHELKAFVHYFGTRSGKNIAAAVAAPLSGYAQRILNVLG
jgi:hypothetical protein